MNEGGTKMNESGMGSLSSVTSVWRSCYFLIWLFLFVALNHLTTN